MGRDRAQSSVIGVVLLTGVVIISVTLIGGFWLGTITDQADASGPLVEVDVTATDEEVEVHHVTGESVAIDGLTILVRNDSVTERTGFDRTNVTGDGDDRFDPTETYVRNHSFGNGTFEVLVIHEASNSVLHSEHVEPDSGDDGDDVGTGAAPTASFSDSPADPRVDDPITFDASGSNDPDGSIASYEWTFGDGQTASGQLVGHRYASSGTYTVTLTVTDGDGRTSVHEETIRIEDRPLLRWQTASDWDGAPSEQGVTHQPFGARDPDSIQLGYSATTDGLVGYWPFDETSGSTAIDASGIGNDGTYQGAPSSREGIFGTSSVGLDGQDDHVSVPDDPSLERSSDDAVTVSAWVFQSSGSSEWVAITQKSDQSYNLQLTNGEEPTFTIYDGGWNEAQSGVSLAPGQWYHLAGTYDGDTARIYVDGALEGSTSGIGQMADASGTDVGIGENLGSTGRHFDGRIDEVRIYDRAIDQATVERLANATGGGYVSESRTASEPLNAPALRLEDVTADVGSGSVSIVVESDPDGDGRWEERSEPVDLAGQAGYDVSGISSNSSRFRLRVRMDAASVTESPVLSNVTITEGSGPEEGQFELSSLTGPSTVDAGETYTVSAAVENTGSAPATRTVRYRFDGSVVEETDVTLASGASTTIELEHTVGGEHRGGNVDHGVYVDGDEATGTMSIAVAPTIDEFDVSGESASGTTDLVEENVYGNNYTIEIRVSDGRGSNTTGTVGDTADGTDP